MKKYLYYENSGIVMGIKDLKDPSIIYDFNNLSIASVHRDGGTPNIPTENYVKDLIAASGGGGGVSIKYYQAAFQTDWKTTIDAALGVATPHAGDQVRITYNGYDYFGFFIDGTKNIEGLIYEGAKPVGAFSINYAGNLMENTFFNFVPIITEAEWKLTTKTNGVTAYIIGDTAADNRQVLITPTGEKEYAFKDYVNTIDAELTNELANESTERKGQDLILQGMIQQESAERQFDISQVQAMVENSSKTIENLIKTDANETIFNEDNPIIPQFQIVGDTQREVIFTFSDRQLQTDETLLVSMQFPDTPIEVFSLPVVASEADITTDSKFLINDGDTDFYAAIVPSGTINEYKFVVKKQVSQEWKPATKLFNISKIIQKKVELDQFFKKNEVQEIAYSSYSDKLIYTSATTLEYRDTKSNLPTLVAAINTTGTVFVYTTLIDVYSRLTEEGMNFKGTFATNGDVEYNFIAKSKRLHFTATAGQWYQLEHINENGVNKLRISGNCDLSIDGGANINLATNPQTFAINDFFDKGSPTAIVSFNIPALAVGLEIMTLEYVASVKHVNSRLSGMVDLLAKNSGGGKWVEVPKAQWTTYDFTNIRKVKLNDHFIFQEALITNAGKRVWTCVFVQYNSPTSSLVDNYAMWEGETQYTDTSVESNGVTVQRTTINRIPITKFEVWKE